MVIVIGLLPMTTELRSMVSDHREMIIHPLAVPIESRSTALDALAVIIDALSRAINDFFSRY